MPADVGGCHGSGRPEASFIPGEDGSVEYVRKRYVDEFAATVTGIHGEDDAGVCVHVDPACPSGAVQVASRQARDTECTTPPDSDLLRRPGREDLVENSEQLTWVQKPCGWRRDGQVLRTVYRITVCHDNRRVVSVEETGSPVHLSDQATAMIPDETIVPGTEHEISHAFPADHPAELGTVEVAVEYQCRGDRHRGTVGDQGPECVP